MSDSEGGGDGAHVSRLAQLEVAFVACVYRRAVGVSLFGCCRSHAVGREGEFVVVPAVDGDRRPAVLGVALNPVFGYPAEVVLPEEGSLGMRIRRQHLDECDFACSRIFGVNRVGCRDGHRCLVAFAVGAGFGRHLHSRTLGGRTVHRRDADPRVVAKRNVPVVGGRYVERRGGRLFGGKGQHILRKSLNRDACGTERILTQFYSVFGVDRMEVVAAVGADGEFARALLAFVLVGEHCDFDSLACFALLRRDDKPAGRFGDFPRSVGAEQEGLGLLGRIEEREASVGYVLGGQRRRQRFTGAALRVVLRAGSRCQERCAEERQEPFVA